MKTAKILFATVLAMLLVDGQVALGQSSPWTQNGDKVYVTDLNAKVGIGTNFPVVKFAMNGDAAVFGGIFTHSFTKEPATTLVQIRSTKSAFLDLTGGTDDTSAYKLILGAVPDFGYVGIISGATGGNNPLPMRFLMGATEVMRLDTNGNVGIGTTTPSVKLVVKGKIHLDVASGDAKIILKRAGLNKWALGDKNGNFRIGAGAMNDANTRLIILEGGNVGIGTVNPTHTLTVNGNITAEEVEVVPDVPADFVFEDDYALRSLAEVERYIDAHGRLPEIPSAAQMQAEGVGLSAMQMKLLQKIEELTLYLIEQHQQIAELEKSNALLREHFSSDQR